MTEAEYVPQLMQVEMRQMAGLLRLLTQHIAAPKDGHARDELAGEHGGGSSEPHDVATESGDFLATVEADIDMARARG